MLVDELIDGEGTDGGCFLRASRDSIDARMCVAFGEDDAEGQQWDRRDQR